MISSDLFFKMWFALISCLAQIHSPLQLDRLTVASRLPNWVDGELKYTFVRDAQSDQILLFKEISWETTRLEADGLKDLQLTPVKLITNACRVRITLKKRLSGESISFPKEENAVL